MANIMKREPQADDKLLVKILIQGQYNIFLHFGICGSPSEDRHLAFDPNEMLV